MSSIAAGVRVGPEETCEAGSAGSVDLHLPAADRPQRGSSCEALAGDHIVERERVAAGLRPDTAVLQIGTALQCSSTRQSTPSGSARHSGVPPPAEWIGRLDRETAYRVQLGILAHHVRGGERHAGWKVGLTSKAMQIQQRVHEPVFGFLLASGRAAPAARAFRSPSSSIPASRTSSASPWGGRCRGPGITLEQAAAALAQVAPAFEIIEKRGDFAADLQREPGRQRAAAIFVTERRCRVPARSTWRAVSARAARVNGAPARSAPLGRAVLGTPVGVQRRGSPNKLAEFGRRLEAGMRR